MSKKTKDKPTKSRKSAEPDNKPAPRKPAPKPKEQPEKKPARKRPAKPAPVPSEPVHQPAPTALRKRDRKGLKPFFTGDGTAASGAAAFGCPVETPKDTSRAELCAWLERLIDHYRSEGLWVTNAGLLFWGSWLGFKMSKDVTSLSTVQDTIRDLLADREEPQEFNPAVRQAIHNKIHNKDTGPKTAAIVIGTQTVESGGHDVEVKTTEGGKGKRHYSLIVKGAKLSVTGFCRWAGAQGHKIPRVRQVLDKLNIPMAESGLAAQVGGGLRLAAGKSSPRGDMPVLTPEQTAALSALFPSNV